jgi:hypothetical protein
MIFRCRNEICNNEINPNEDLFCKSCRERLNPEDAAIRKFCEENPSYYDPNGDLPIILDKNGRQLTHEEILSVCDSPNSGHK